MGVRTDSVYTCQNLTHCASTAARSAASCAAGSSELGGADDGVGTSTTLGVRLAAGLLAVAADETVEGSMTDALPIVRGLVVLGPSAEPEVHPATPRTTARPHPTTRQRKPGLLISR